MHDPKDDAEAPPPPPRPPEFGWPRMEYVRDEAGNDVPVWMEYCEWTQPRWLTGPGGRLTWRWNSSEVPSEVITISFQKLQCMG